MFDFDIKEKEHQTTRQSDLHLGATPPRTNQIALCFDALSITNTVCKMYIYVRYNLITSYTPQLSNEMGTHD
jgi:hypothetical protein